jgi:rRNA maturation endonuclease Nob1
MMTSEPKAVCHRCLLVFDIGGDLLCPWCGAPLEEMPLLDFPELAPADLEG